MKEEIIIEGCSARYVRNVDLLCLIDWVRLNGIFYWPQFGIICKLYAENIYEKQHYTLLCITEIHYMSIRHGEYYKGPHYSIGVCTRYHFLCISYVIYVHKLACINAESFGK
jgi:hypothetical protein